jgi:hypothetical protein
MDLLHTIPMLKLFNLENIRVLHLEPTTVCNAACPQCGREDLSLYNDQNDRSELTVEKIIKLIDLDFISRLEKMFMCGNFGDPAAAAETLQIYQYFRKHNSKITLGMNTNGGLRSTSWWKELASIFNLTYDYVVFSIDGLEDTNHVYRRNTSWHKIMDNATAFIGAGGTAHWDMLIYEHNEHQIEACEKLAKEMGFSWFRAKVSKRFDVFPIRWLSPPKSYELPNVHSNGPIECHALKEKSIYISADGKKLPCCWFGAESFTLDAQAKHLLEDWNGRLIPSWIATPHRICQNTCTQDTQGTSFSKQWKIEKQLR